MFDTPVRQQMKLEYYVRILISFWESL